MTSHSLDQLRSSLYSAVVSDVLDELGFRHQSPRFAFPIRTTETVLIGRCRTTLWEDVEGEDPNPYEKELLAVDACQADDVMICAANGSMRSGIWGELLSTAVLHHACAGVIVDGAVRDVTKTRAMSLPVFARGTSVRDSKHRQRVVDYNVSVRIDEMLIQNNDLVIADVDGIVFIPQAVETETLEKALKKVLEENKTREAIKAGMGAKEAYDRFGVL